MTTAIYRHYAPVGSSETGLVAHSGQRAVVGPIAPESYDFEDIGAMFTVVFDDGYTGEAFGDELTEWEEDGNAVED